MTERSEAVLPTSDSVPAQPVAAGSEAVGSSSAWDLPTKRTVMVILLILMVLVLWVSRPILPLLVLSSIIAYLLNPVIDLVERVRVPRGIATILLFLLLLLAVALLPIILAPVLIRQLATLSNFDVQNSVRGVLNWFNTTLLDLPSTVTLLGYELPIGEAIRQLQLGYQNFNFIPTLAEVLTYIQQLIVTTTNVVSTTAFISFNVVGGIFQVVISVVIVFFLSLYMTKDAPRIRAYLAGLFPPSYQSEVVDLFRRVGSIWQAFFRGQILLSVVVGVVTWIALTAVAMPGALLLAILAGFLEVIPNLGPTLAMLPAVVIALIQGSPTLTPLGFSHVGFAMIVVAIYVIVQQLENHILVPRIIGSSVNLHPIVVICGVLIGFNLFGILGALLAAPTIASLRVVGTYIHAKLLGYEPFLDRRAPPNRSRQFVYRRTVTGAELAVTDPKRAIAAASTDQAGTLNEGSIGGDGHPPSTGVRPSQDAAGSISSL